MRLTPRQFQLIAAFAVVALFLTIVSGAAVRLTGSGLGCPDWPSCTRTDVVAPLQFHSWIEFGNRLINAAVTIAAIGVFAAAMLRNPRRRDLTILSAAVVIGLLLEVAMGAIVVYYKLAPGLVMTHFLLGMAFLAVTVILHHRAGIPDRATRFAQLDRPQILLGRLLLGLTAMVVTLGSIVTSTGPHGGSPSTPRFDFSLHRVAQLHGSSAEVLIAVSLFALWALLRSEAPRPVLRRAEIFLAVLIAQGAIGYTQYLNGDPAALVELHVAGAALLVVAVLRYYLGTSIYRVAEGTSTPPAPAEESLWPLPLP